MSIKNRRIMMIMLLDIGVLFVSQILAYMLRFEGIIPSVYMQTMLLTSGVFVGLSIIVFYFVGLYNSIWKYASVEELFSVIIGNFLAQIVAFAAFYMFIHPILIPNYAVVPKGVFAIAFMISVFATGGIRFSYRMARQARHEIKKTMKNSDDVTHVLIYGAGEAGVMVGKDLKSNREKSYHLVGFLDDDASKLNLKILGTKVLGNRQNIGELVLKKQVNEVILAVPAMHVKDKKAIIDLCNDAKVIVKTLPSLSDLVSGKVTISEIRPVEIEDLLGRDPVVLNMDEISSFISGKVILLTGGGGSIGSEICRQLAHYQPQEIIIFEINENNAHDAEYSIRSRFPDVKVTIIIGNIREYDRVDEVFRTYRPSIVFHAAAHKHVPLMETNPFEAIKNNVFGTYHVVDCAAKNNIEKFVLISTDKAVNPTNIMGATKRFAEMIIQAYSKATRTEFVAVRFGNVLGSAGSVIPRFKEQIKAGGPVTVTHRDITRYFMTIPEAAKLVIQAGAMAVGGEIFVLDMGEPIQIDRLARDMIRLSGFEPDMEIDVVYTGLRPGEKLYEELFLASEALKETSFPSIMVAKPMDISVELLRSYLDSIGPIKDEALLRKRLFEIIQSESSTL